MTLASAFASAAFRCSQRRSPTSSARKESSIPGIHVAGDATTLAQAALQAAAEGAFAAAAMNHLLTIEDATRSAAAEAG